MGNVRISKHENSSQRLRMNFRESPGTGSFYVPGSIGVDPFEICDIRHTLAESGGLHVFRLNNHEAIQEWLRLEVRQREACPAATSKFPITSTTGKSAQTGIFMDLLPFDAASVNSVPAKEGVYIIYKNGVPFYVGRSRVDIRRRLRSHLKGTGSRKVANEPSGSLQFEYCNLASLEQAEAILIRELDTRKIGNLRFESDPGDWKFPCRVCNSNKCTDYEDRSDGGNPTEASVASGTAICRCGHNYKEHE